MLCDIQVHFRCRSIRPLTCAPASRGMRRLQSGQTRPLQFKLLLLLQERFRENIHKMDSVIDGAVRMTRGAAALNMPVLVTGNDAKPLQVWKCPADSLCTSLQQRQNLKPNIIRPHLWKRSHTLACRAIPEGIGQHCCRTQRGAARGIAGGPQDQIQHVRYLECCASSSSLRHRQRRYDAAICWLR